jgi:hypothetical protein
MLDFGIDFLTDRLERFWSPVRQQSFGLTQSVMRHFRAAALMLIGLLAVAGLADKRAKLRTRCFHSSLKLIAERHDILSKVYHLPSNY